MKEPLNRWLFIVLLLVLVIAWNTLVGCSQVPKCELFQYSVHMYQGEPYFVLDQANAVKLTEMVNDLSQGRCRIE